MQRWIVLIVVVVLIALAAFTTPLWLTPFLNFVGANASTIQGLQSLVQLILWVVAGAVALWGYARGRQRSGEAAKTSTRIKTGGGAAIQGDAQVDRGSKLVGRDDQSINIETDVVIASDRMLREFRRVQPPIDLKPATEAYLKYLLDRHRYLNLKGMGVFDKVPIRLPLLDLYVPLKARREMPEGETWKRDPSTGAGFVAGRALTEEQQALAGRLSEPQPVLELLQKSDGLIILGDPGAGKTTFLKFLALQLALGAGGAIGLGNRLPVLAPLSAYANALAQQDVRLDDFIVDYLHDVGVDCPLDDMLRTALKSGTALILLDGLDEVKDLKLRHVVVERVTDFCTFHRRAGNKFVITSRIIGYRAVRPTAEGLLECTLIDFDDDEIQAFVTRWTAAFEKQAQEQTTAAQSDAARERKDLLDAVGRNPSVRRLAANPLLLTILALMKRQNVTLPERRVELYDQYVRALLSSWNRVRGLGRPPARDLDVVQTMRVLAPLALWMHEVNPGVGLVKREDLRRKLIDIYNERGEIDPEAATTQFIDDVHEHAGLLLERGPGEYGFIHLTFEEYLAAVALALKGQGNAAVMAEYLSDRVGEDAWREVALLTIGYVGLIQQLERVAGDTVEKLNEALRGEPGEAVVLAGEAVLDAWPGGVPPSSRQKIIEALLPAMRNAEVKPLLRRKAGLLLGRLGWSPADLDEFVEAPAGKFLYSDPPKPREIPYRYWLAKYPVTNLQFKRFMDAGGYDDPQWWSREGWSWRQGTYDSKADDDLRDFLQRRPVEKRDRPFFWDDHERANPIFPVVGVCWFEAEAYGKWLDAQLKVIRVKETDVPKPGNYCLRLATEEEWERAARGTDGREYPWQGEFDRAKANTTESGDIGATAVCTYPQGASPIGAWDMSGNVWEWTKTPWEKYRVLRGGSWILNARFARCAIRPRLDPVYFYDNLGLRVVLSLASAEF